MRRRRAAGVAASTVLTWWSAGIADAAPAQETIARSSKADLEPVAGFFTCHSPEYHLHLRVVLRREVPRDTDLQVLKSPAFEPDVLASVHEADSGPTVSLVIPDRDVWMVVRDKGDVDAIRCRVVEKALPAGFVPRLRTLWRAMLLRTRYQDSNVTQLDGVVWQFFAFERGRGHRSGRTHSPDEGTRAFALAAVADRLIEYAGAGSGDDESALARLDAAMRALERELGAESGGEKGR